MKYITDISVDKITVYQDFTGKYDDFVRDRVLAYLRAFKASGFTSQPVIDAFTGEMVAGADNGYTDGVYIWYESEVYYFEKYDLALTKDFLDYVVAVA